MPTMQKLSSFAIHHGAHRWYYDEETIRLLLESVGFVDVKRREFDPAVDQEYRRVGSMYIQCSKRVGQIA
jgi:hypothetical protein